MVVTCLLGDPVDHSISNYLFDYYAREFKLDYSHVKLQVDSNNQQNLEIAINALRAMNFAGANITLPYKLDVIPYLDEIHESAKVVGAVNTVVNRNRQLVGYNTDSYGAIQTIKNELPSIDKNTSVLILGAGGAARAVLYEIQKITKNIIILNRSSDRLQKLKEDFKEVSGIKYDLLSPEALSKSLTKSDLIINATSVGMYPHNRESLIPTSILSKQDIEKSFFDVIFNPEPTKFLQNADKYNNYTVGGMRMMIYQGIKAFELWTGYKVSEKSINGAYNILISYLHE